MSSVVVVVVVVIVVVVVHLFSQEKKNLQTKKEKIQIREKKGKRRELFYYLDFIVLLCMRQVVHNNVPHFPGRIPLLEPASNENIIFFCYPFLKQHLQESGAAQREVLWKKKVSNGLQPVHAASPYRVHYTLTRNSRESDLSQGQHWNTFFVVLCPSVCVCVRRKSYAVLTLMVLLFEQTSRENWSEALSPYVHTNTTLYR